MQNPMNSFIFFVKRFSKRKQKKKRKKKWNKMKRKKFFQNPAIFPWECFCSQNKSRLGFKLDFINLAIKSYKIKMK